MTMGSTDRDATIRTAHRDDVPAMKGIIDSVQLFPSKMIDGLISTYLNDGASEDHWIAYDIAGVAAAFAYYAEERFTVGTWNLHLIAVHAAHHSKGIGQALLRYIEHDVNVRGGRGLLIETSALPSFRRTYNFYAQNGYDEEARIREFYQAGEDKIVFRKAFQTPPGTCRI